MKDVCCMICLQVECQEKRFAVYDEYVLHSAAIEACRREGGRIAVPEVRVFSSS